MKINKTVLGVVAASLLAATSVVYAQFSLTDGGGGWGYGYGYGLGYGTDAGLYSYRTTGASADQYSYGYGYVTNTSNVTNYGGGGSYYGGGVVFGYPTGTVTTNVVPNASCSPIFNTNMRAKIYNSNEVRKLQSFLNKYNGEALPVTGNFLGLTTAAVNRFQVKYSSDILAPIGKTVGTNNFYSYSRAKANAIYCANPMNLGY
jgi:hypothetical protein